jgi:hypothetical protein
VNAMRLPSADCCSDDEAERRHQDFGREHFTTLEKPADPGHAAPAVLGVSYRIPDGEQDQPTMLSETLSVFTASGVRFGGFSRLSRRTRAAHALPPHGQRDLTRADDRTWKCGLRSIVAVVASRLALWCPGIARSSGSTEPSGVPFAQREPASMTRCVAQQ